MENRQRLNPRLEIELPAQYRVSAPDEPQRGKIANLSLGGAAVLTESQLPPHSLLDQFRFALPGPAAIDPVETTAVVIHAHPYLDDQGSIAYVSGLQFLKIETSAFERLERFLVDQFEKGTL